MAISLESSSHLIVLYQPPQCPTLSERCTIACSNAAISDLGLLRHPLDLHQEICPAYHPPSAEPVNSASSATTMRRSPVTMSPRNRISHMHNQAAPINPATAPRAIKGPKNGLRRQGRAFSNDHSPTTIRVKNYDRSKRSHPCTIPGYLISRLMVSRSRTGVRWLNAIAGHPPCPRTVKASRYQNSP